MGRLVVAGLLVLVCACGEPGDRLRAGWSVYESPGGDYRIPYQEPPWRITASGARTVTLSVPSVAERFVPDAGLLVDPRYALSVDVESGRAADRIEEEARRAPDRDHTILAGPRPLRTEHGAIGFDLLTIDPLTRRHRVVHIDRPAGGVLSLRFEGNPDLDEPQVDVMVTGVEVTLE
jgi:hypothetical protein